MARLTSALVIAAVLLTGAASAQEGPEKAQDLKEKLLEKIREKIRAEHKKILQRVEEIIDEELKNAQAKKEEKKEAKEEEKKEDDAASVYEKKIRELERRIKKLEIEKTELALQKRHLERFKEDDPIAKRAKKDGPLDGEAATKLFDSALEAHRKKDFKTSIPDFKRIFYNFPQTPLGATAAYNISCGYALDGDKDLALDWLEISVQFGFREFDHIRRDTDMDSLRGDIRYKRLLADK
ncbi:MAG: TPR end-of-group domain-containing protein [Planctomycetota bacterium]|jgi:TolA-binding protein